MLLVCLYVGWYDIDKFLHEKQPNIYSLIDLDRSAKTETINDRLNLAFRCFQDADPEDCNQFKTLEANYLDQTEIMQLRHVLTKDHLRELYDKTETFVRPRLEKQG